MSINGRLNVTVLNVKQHCYLGNDIYFHLSGLVAWLIVIRVGGYILIIVCEEGVGRGKPPSKKREII